jgi:hypothetical protein
MIPAAQLDAIRARWSLREIVSRDVALKKAGRQFVALCPFHQEKTPSFYIFGDRYHCFGCGSHGDAIEYLRRTRNLDFRAAVAHLAGAVTLDGVSSHVDSRPPGNRAGVSLSEDGASGRGRRTADDFPLAPIRRVSPADAPCGSSDTQRQARALWESATEPRVAEFYLRSRGIMPYGPLPAALRGHSRVLYSEPCGDEKPTVDPSWRTWQGDDGQWWKSTHKPALIAAVTDLDGNLTAVQRIWCERSYEVDSTCTGPQDARARGISTRKKTLGHLGNGAVQLAPATDTLGLAEGVETGVAAMRLFRFPVWATCGSARLHSITLPDCVERVLIFADRGEAGERAAEQAVKTYGRRGDAQALFPDAPHKDWNEQLIGRGK